MQTLHSSYTPIQARVNNPMQVTVKMKAVSQNNAGKPKTQKKVRDHKKEQKLSDWQEILHGRYPKTVATNSSSERWPRLQKKHLKKENTFYQNVRNVVGRQHSEARRPDLVAVYNENRERHIIDLTVQNYKRINRKGKVKIAKHQNPVIQRLWNQWVKCIPIVIGAVRHIPIAQRKKA